MGKVILKFGGIDIEKTKFTPRNSYLLEGVYIEKVLVSNKIFSSKMAINALLVTCLMIIELRHYM